MVEPAHEHKPFPTASEQFLLSGPAGMLEVNTDVPEPDVVRDVTALLCHPLGDDGGTLHNKVNQIMERSFREMGARTVRFNFRGCGSSEGEYDQGAGETDDLLSVYRWVRAARPNDEIWLGGYGFGAYVAARASREIPATHLVIVSPPMDQFAFDDIEVSEAPLLVITAELDSAVSPENVTAWIEKLPNESRMLVMDDTDETFHRRLMDLRGAIKSGIRRIQKNGEPEV